MKIEIDIVPLITILKSKTLTKILAKILEAQSILEIECKNVDGISFSMDNLRKSLRYKNKSTVSRGIKALADLGLFNLETTNQGTIVDFKTEKIRRV